jgi:hypothetical protein
MTTISIVLEHNNVELTLLVDKNLKQAYSEPSGFFLIHKMEETCWDNFSYFINLPFEKFVNDFDEKEEKRLKELGYKKKDLYKSIKKLIKLAKKMGLWFE